MRGAFSGAILFALATALFLVHPTLLQAARPELQPPTEIDVPGDGAGAAKAAPGAPGIDAGDTTWIADWSFDGPGGCDDSGWTHYDNRILNDGSNYWAVDDRFTGIGGITGNAAVLSKHDLSWVWVNGYGNDWDYSIVLQYRGAGATLSFQFICDTDPGYDVVTVEADSLGLSEALVDYTADPLATPAGFRSVLYTADGWYPAGSVSGLGLPDFDLPGSTHEAYIRFSSNSSYSHEDNCGDTWCSFAYDAALAVDSIAVTGDLAYTEDFEGTLDPHISFQNTAPATPFGEWARLFPHATDNDKCAENTTCSWIFSDPQRPAYSSAMAFGPGGVVLRNWLDDVLVSPWVSLGGTAGAAATVLSYRRFPGNNFSKGRIVLGWRVRSRVRIDNTDTPAPGDSIDAVSPWVHTSSFNTLSTFAWGTTVADMTSYIVGMARDIQVSFRVSDWQLLAGAAPPATLDTGPGPYIDRVRIGRRVPLGPTLGPVFENEMAQDAFPSAAYAPGCWCAQPVSYAATTDRFGTCDFSRSAPSMCSTCCPLVFCVARCDSIGLYVTDVRGAGIADVSFYGAIVAGPHAGKAPPPWTVGANGFFRVPAQRGVRCEQVVANWWNIDLDDEYFRGGDVLYYFFSAADGAGGYASYPLGLVAEPGSIAQAEAAMGGLIEVSFLPAIDWDPAYLARIAAHPSGKLDPTPEEIANSEQRSCILYVNQTVMLPRSGGANRTAFLHTLDRLGYGGLCDVYDLNARGASVSNNQLAGRATVEQAAGYALIVHDAGRFASHTTLPIGNVVEGYWPQTQWYRDWLAQAPLGLVGRASLWLIGNDIAANAVGNPLVTGEMGVTLVSAGPPSGAIPLVLGETSFTWADSSTTDFTGDSFALSGYSCPTIYSYDGLGASGTAAVTHRYYAGATPGAGAAVANANAASSWNTILMSFSWDDLRDPEGSPPEAQEDDLAGSILQAVLPESCRARAVPTGVHHDSDRVPSVTRLYQNAPNPFNPLTVIVFDLHRDGVVRLQVFDVAGRRVRTLHDGPVRAGWKHRVTWNGLDEAGRAVASGVYIYRLEANDLATQRKMVVLR